MDEMLNVSQDEYMFEAPPEVLQRMQRAYQAPVLIPEECVRDLVAVDVSGRVYCRIKRLFDIVLSCLGIIVMLIPIALIAILIYVDDPGSVFFSQYRIGVHGKRFKLYKFRTMKMSTPKYMATMELENPEQYITRVGRFLRKSSMDEILQLWNVLRGDMSLVGPRPLIADEYEIHIMRTRFGVYNIRPGITGLAQVNGRDLVQPGEKVRWDVKYLQGFGILMDIKILFLTMINAVTANDVVEGVGSSQSGMCKK